MSDRLPNWWTNGKACSRIPRVVEIWREQGFEVHELFDQPSLLSAKREGMMEAAEIAEGKSREFDMQAALAECRDAEYGFHHGRIKAAEDIRQKAQEIGK